MSWNKVSEIEPPKDRLIEVTNGFAWHPELSYTYYDNPKLHVSPIHDVTYRYWKGRGQVYLVIWNPNASTGEGKNFDKLGMWALPNHEMGPQDFLFWREFENPLVDENSYTSVFPPAALVEEAKGNWTKSKMLAEADKAKNELSTIEEVAAREPLRASYFARLIEATKARIEKLLAGAELAKDLPLPPKN